MKKNLLVNSMRAAVSGICLGALPVIATAYLAKEAKNKIEAKIYKLRNKDILKEEKD